MEPKQPHPVMAWTKFIYLNSSDVEWIKIDCIAAGKAIDRINEVCDLAKPVDSIVNQWLYDADYVKTVILSWSVREFREMLLQWQMNAYIRDIYKLQVSEDSKNLGQEQKEWLKALDLKFEPNKPFDSSEIRYVNNLVELYIDIVEPILREEEQSTMIKFKHKDEVEKIALDKRIFLI